MDLSALGNDIERVVVSEEQIQTRLKELANQVEKDYQGRDLILVGVLKGAIMAMADFSRHLQRHVDMDWMAVSSYGAGTKSSGVVRILKDLERLPKAIRSRVLRLAIYKAGAPAGSLSAEHIAATEALISDWHGQKEVALPGNVKLLRNSGRIILSTHN